MHLPKFITALLLAMGLLVLSPVNAQPTRKPQRVIIIMMDGFGEDYYRASEMPTLNRMERQGLYKVVPGLMPSVTNVNNASIITGEPAEKNGITGNVFLDPATGKEEYTEDPKQLLLPTLFDRAGKAGVRSMLLSCKTKTVQLLRSGAGDTLCWENASAEWIRRLGPKPDIYSREVNYWIMEAALYSIAHDPGLGLVFIHTTDYPMHTWAPESPESREHLHKMDEYIARLIRAAPDAAILITADHTVHHKSRCWDLDKACADRGLPLRAAISPEKDRYFKHHLGLGGSAYIYLRDAADSARARQLLLGLPGVEEVISREEAVRRYHLMPERIGDLMVMADSTTVFGHLENASFETLAAGYRSHGSAYEARVPLFVYNAHGAPATGYFTANYRIAAWLYK
jgi:phosphonoacetate hydrolase